MDKEFKTLNICDINDDEIIFLISEIQASFLCYKIRVIFIRCKTFFLNLLHLIYIFIKNYFFLFVLIISDSIKVFLKLLFELILLLSQFLSPYKIVFSWLLGNFCYLLFFHKMVEQYLILLDKWIAFLIKLRFQSSWFAHPRSIFSRKHSHLMFFIRFRFHHILNAMYSCPQVSRS
jgi:hypothetical protein